MQVNKGIQSVRSTCSYCGVGCGVVVHRNRRGQLWLEGDKDHPVNKGMLCSKGRNLHYTVMDQSDRLLYPACRNTIHDNWERRSWDASLTHVADKIQSVINEHGPDAIGFYVSGQCLTEEYYVANKLVKGFIGTNNIDTNSRLCMSSAVMGYKIALGDDVVPACYDDIEQTNCMFIAGANPAWCHPILFRRMEKYKEENPDVKIIVVDPRETETCSIADLHLPLQPGTDIHLYNAIARILLDNKWIDEEFIQGHTTGFSALKTYLQSLSLEDTARRCGIPLEDIQTAAQYIGESGSFMTFWAMGLNQSVEGVNKNLALLNLSLLTGQIGKPGSGPLSLTGQPNAMGGREVGGMATMLAAHHDLANPVHRKKIARYWGGCEISEKPGLTATQMIDALLEKELKVVWIVCTNPMVSLPNLKKVQEALENAEMVIVQDISSKSDTLDFAHVVFPAAGWLEKDGTMTNSERRISYLNKMQDPPGEARPDAEILCAFARKMGYKGFDYQSACEIFDEYKALTKDTIIDISGLKAKILQDGQTVQWPYHGQKHGTARMFASNEFLTKTGKAVLSTVKPVVNIETITTQYPLLCTTGRIRDQWHTMTRTGKVNRLFQHIPEPFLEIHPDDARERKITENEMIEIHNQRGYVKVKAKITPRMKKGVVFLPMHWGKILNSHAARANNVTSSHTDPVSKQPDFKYSAVQVNKIVSAKQKLIVVGAGAASFRFVTEYRQRNKTDEIQVFSKEPHAFYNRILLPEYLNGAKKWEDLQKLTGDELKELGITLHTGISVIQIDKENKMVMDSNNNNHGYDKLVLAMGSKASWQAEFSEPGEKVFTVRCREDIERLLQQLPKEPARKNVCLIGGGLLSLEMADALCDLGYEVHLLVRGNQLMRKQLDVQASNLLTRFLEKKGIQIWFGTSMEKMQHKEKEDVLSISLSNNKTLSVEAVVFGIGMQADVNLVRQTGMETDQGIVVNEYMQTSVQDIYAIGEVAAYQGKTFGLTYAAEQQADVAVQHMLGNETQPYMRTIEINILKCKGIELCSIGQTSKLHPDEEEIILLGSSYGLYKKCIVRNDRLIGAILVGDTDSLLEYKQLIEQKIELGEKREALIDGKARGNKEPVEGKLVCSCNQVGEGNIKNAFKSEFDSPGDLILASNAGTGCGSCKPMVKRIFNEMRKREASLIDN